MTASGVLPGPSAADRAVKRERVDAILAARGASSLVLRSAAAVSWYLDGTRAHISFAGDPVLAVVVEADGAERVVTSSNERDRLVAEELPAGIEVVALPWHTPLPSVFPTGSGALDEADVAAELRAARASLLPAETARFEALGRECAEVLTDALPLTRPDDPEFVVAGRVSGALLARGIEPLVVLVGGADRRGHRHPLPGTGLVGDRAMVVVCGRRGGLIANVTRWLRFTEPSAAERDAEARIRSVEAAFFAATRVGLPLGDVLAEAVAAYPDAGFAESEWLEHHQGGPAGYNGRDPRATPGALDLVAPNQAFAWNPTAPGVKVEDTVLLAPGGDESAAPVVLTRDPRWPSTLAHGLERPDELIIR